MGLPFRVYAFAAGVLLFGLGLASLADAPSAYQVRIAESGDGCSTAHINIDTRTGHGLICMGPGTADDPPSPFTTEEEKRVYALARDLGDRHHGLTDEDEAQIRGLVNEIATAHGDPDTSGDQAGSLGHLAVLAGLPLALGGGVLLLTRGVRDPEF